MAEDILYRGMHGDAAIRFSYTVCTAAANEAVLRHGCDPLSAHVLCRALGAGILVSPLLVGDERYTLSWHYGGALKSVVVDVGSNGWVRGFVAPPNLMVAVESEEEIYGQSGLVTVVKSDTRRTLNSGSTPAGLLDVVEDLAYFFSVSDQIETAMTVMVGFQRDTEVPVSLCQGVMLQAMPACDLERFDRMRGRLASAACRDALSRVPQIDNHFEHILGALCGGDEDPSGFAVHPGSAPGFRCRCSRERMLSVVRALPPEEIAAGLSRTGSLRVSCQFCGAVHELPAEEVHRAIQGDGDGASQ